MEGLVRHNDCFQDWGSFFEITFLVLFVLSLRTGVRRCFCLLVWDVFCFSWSLSVSIGFLIKAVMASIYFSSSEVTKVNAFPFFQLFRSVQFYEHNLQHCLERQN